MIHRSPRQILAPLLRRLPAGVRRAVLWWLRPSLGWIRLPVAFLLILGGVFSFLPVLGLWMVPVGLALAAQDIPPLRGMLVWMVRLIGRFLPATPPPATHVQGKPPPPGPQVAGK